MKMPSDFKDAKGYTGGGGGFLALPAGGHICRIINARETVSRNGNQMFEVAFDIDEGTEYDGMFNSRFQELRAAAADAKWPNGGMFRTAILNREGKTSGFFKGLITAVEESNAGFRFVGPNGEGNPESLRNRMVGFNFREEEYLGRDGKVRTAVKAAYAVSVGRVQDGIDAPEKKALRNDNANRMAAEGFVEVDDSTPLPF